MAIFLLLMEGILDLFLRNEGQFYPQTAVGAVSGDLAIGPTDKHHKQVISHEHDIKIEDGI